MTALRGEIWLANLKPIKRQNEFAKNRPWYNSSKMII